MLDQSFSAKNFETIYNRESRKGNIDLHDMPEDYRSAVHAYVDCRKNMREFIQRPKKMRTSTYNDDLAQFQQKVADLKKHKELVLKQYFEDVAKRVNSKKFRFAIKSSYIEFNGKKKEIFSLEGGIEGLYVMKQLQHNISRTFKVKQSNRYTILECIKPLLSSKIPLWVIRTDISSFYESIPQERLLRMVNNNSLLSSKSKSLIKVLLDLFEQKKDTTQIQPGIGIPRGIGISPLLSEIYMREIDNRITSNVEVVFFARYVDDIFIICKPGHSLSIEDYYNNTLCNLFSKYGLELKNKNRNGDKCELIDLTSENRDKISFDYLGYKIYIYRTKKEGTKVDFDLSNNKEAHIKHKIDSIITHCENLACIDMQSTRRDLLDGLRWLSCNYSLSKSKHRVKVGLYYTNNLLTRMDGLCEMTKYLHEKVLSPRGKLLIAPTDDTKRYFEHLNNRIQKLDLKKAWNEKLYYPFTMKRLKEMETWL